MAFYINDRSDDLGYLIIKGYSFNYKLNLFKTIKLAYVTNSFEGEIQTIIQDKLQQLLVRIKDFQQFRNKIIHANWHTLTEDNFVRTKITDAKGNIKFQMTKITPSRIAKKTKGLEQISIDLYDFQEEIGLAP